MTNKEKAIEITNKSYNHVFGGYLFTDQTRDLFLKLIKNPESEYVEVL